MTDVGTTTGQSREDLAAALAAAIGVPAAEVVAGDADGGLCLDVPAARWRAALLHARDAWGCRYFDWLSAVDQTDAADAPGLDVVIHVAHLPAPDDVHLRRVLLRTRVPSSALVLDSVTDVFPGAAWHERETHEMFGLELTGFDDGSGSGLRPLLLPDGFEGTPLRKQFQLASRAAKPWPGAKEPGESDSGAASPSRRKLLPPGVPDAATWGPRPPASPVASEEVAAPATTPADASDTGEGEPRA